MINIEKEALEYHAMGRPGKVEVVASKPCTTSKQLSLAYSPGVAEPCLAIAKDPAAVFRYTTKGNLVAVISNGTAVLGLGNIGPLAGKPVMEGKGVLFKRFADIDVFDLELDTLDPQEFIDTVRRLDPTFGGINLEDIKAPECFQIEEQLVERMNIPVFHDDQHGTAIIGSAALINACEITGRKLADVRMVVNGAGAAGLACAELCRKIGLQKENITLCDSQGVVYQGRQKGMNEYKERWAVKTDARTLADALVGADVFFGVSVAGALTPAMLKNMAKDPIIFAMANPVPEIDPQLARQVRPDAIIATGRSDYPNQVNNVLGFPFIFRGALDVQARKINDEMKIAAAHALAELARQDVPDSVAQAYEGRQFSFGREYIIPKPFDPRVLLWVAPAVARTALETGVARLKNFDLEGYRDRLERLLGPANWIMRNIVNIAKRNPKRIVFPEGDDISVLRATQLIVEEGVATPVLIGEKERVEQAAREAHCHLDGCEILDNRHLENSTKYIEHLFSLRNRKGMTKIEAQRWLRSNRLVLGSLLVQMKEVDGMVGGVNHSYPDAIRPVLQIVGRRPESDVSAGVFMLLFKDRVIFMADCAINHNPTAEQIASIGQLTARLASFFGLIPRVAMLAFSNFGSVRENPITDKMTRATQILKERMPELEVDGEMQTDTALNYELLRKHWSFSALTKEANVLIFPDLMSANASYKVAKELGGAKAIGPLLVGINGKFNVVQRSCDPETIMNLTAVTVCQAGGHRSLGVVKD